MRYELFWVLSMIILGARPRASRFRITKCHMSAVRSHSTPGVAGGVLCPSDAGICAPSTGSRHIFLRMTATSHRLFWDMYFRTGCFCISVHKPSSKLFLIHWHPLPEGPHGCCWCTIVKKEGEELHPQKPPPPPPPAAREGDVAKFHPH